MTFADTWQQKHFNQKHPRPQNFSRDTHSLLQRVLVCFLLSVWPILGLGGRIKENSHIETLMHIFINVLLEVQSSVLKRMGLGWGEVTPYRHICLDGHAHALMMRGASQGCLPLVGVLWSSFQKSGKEWHSCLWRKELFFFLPETGELLFPEQMESLSSFNIALNRLFNGQTFWGARAEGLEFHRNANCT